MAALKEEITREQASQQVRQRELAEAVTANTVPTLAQLLAAAEASGEAKITEFFAGLLFDYAGALGNYGRPQPALDLYNLAEPVYGRLDCEVEVARCRKGRAESAGADGPVRGEAVADCDAADPALRK